VNTNAESDPSTRQRLLESACDLFAQKGFTRTTNRDICDRAGANIAAVNYYFGSKQNLYAEAWRKAFRDSLAAHPPDGGVPPAAPPEERLRGRISALIRGNADYNNKSFLIAHKEMANPTRLLAEVMHECIQPLHAEMTGLVRELLGPHATEQHVRFCEVSIVSQCMYVMRWRHFRREQKGGGGPPMGAEDIDAYAEHVAEFSLAGIRKIRERLGEGPVAD
jgi:AcrR family transcriptional regulator